MGGAPGVRRSHKREHLRRTNVGGERARLTTRAEHISNDYTGWTTVPRCSIASVRQWRFSAQSFAGHERNLGSSTRNAISVAVTRLMDDAAIWPSSLSG
jgi:hypothetical protein